MNILGIVTYAIRAQIAAEDPTLEAQLTDSENGLRVYFLTAPARAHYPWIRVTHVWGGYENVINTQSFDAYFEVSAISPDMQEANQVASDVLDTLQGKRVAYPGNWSDWAGTTLITPASGIVEIQGEQFYSIGSVVRFRANLLE